MAGQNQSFWSFLLGLPSTEPTDGDAFVRLDSETNLTQKTTWLQIRTILDARYARFVENGKIIVSVGPIPPSNPVVNDLWVDTN